MRLLILPALFSTVVCFAQTAKPVKPVVYNSLGVKSAPRASAVSMELYARFQHKVAAPKNANDKYDVNINSPKSVNYLPEKGKFYVQSLEGNETVVYDLKS